MASPRNGVNVEATSVTNGSSKENEIDREKVCPLLLRVFCANSRHNNLSDYNRGKYGVSLISFLNCCFIIECFIEKNYCLQVNVCHYYNAEKQFDAPFTSIEDQHDFFKRKVSFGNNTHTI